MANRVKITGYVNVEDNEFDAGDPTGLTEDAYMDLISDENGTGLKVVDLLDVEVERQ